MSKIINAFTNGLKSAGQAELAQYHMNFNQYLTGNPYSSGSSYDTDSAEVGVYEKGSSSWVNIALNRKMLDVSNIELFFADDKGEKIDDKNIPDDILMPFQSGYAGMGINEMLAIACGQEDLSGNAIWLKDSNANRLTQLTGMPGRFIPITPGNFKIELNQRGTAIETITITWKNGEQTIVTPDKVIQFKRNAVISPFIGIGLISQGRALVEFDAVAMEYQTNFLEKDGTPDLIYLDKNQSSPEMARAKAAQLRADYKAGKYSNSIMYAYGDVDVKSFAISSSDLQFIENRKMNSDQVISLMESTGSILGIPDANNRASAGVLTNNYFGIVNSRIDHLIEAINKQFVWTVKGNEKRKISLAFTPYPTGDIETIQKAVINGLMTPANGAKSLGLPSSSKDEASNTLYINRGVGTLQSVYETEPMTFGSLSDDIEMVKKKTKIRDYE